jgi:hypothetical protein
MCGVDHDAASTVGRSPPNGHRSSSVLPLALLPNCLGRNKSVSAFLHAAIIITILALVLVICHDRRCEL